MTLRIAQITATFPPYPGGTGTVCLHQAIELARRGHSVHVFTASLAGAAPREVRDGITIHRLRPLARLGNAPVLPQLLRRLRGYDLIHLHCPFILGAELTALAAALHGTPLVVTYHNDLIPGGTWRDHVFRLATWSSRVVVLGRAAQVLFVSQGHAESCEQRVVYRRRAADCRVLPNGVDTAHFRPAADRDAIRTQLGLPLDRPVIGFVGGLDRAHHYKGLEVLLAALAAPALAEAALLVVGDGDLAALYRQEARRLGLDGRVRFQGAVAQPALPPLYRACDAVAMPSLVAESFGLVVAEALACGVPIVASDGPGVRMLVTPGVHGLLVPPGDAGALAGALAELLADPARLRAMGARGQADIAAHFSWPTIGAQLEAIYLRLLGRADTRAAAPAWSER